MKKSIILCSMFTMFTAVTAFAAPITMLSSDRGIAVGVGTKETYIEGKINPKATVGYEYLDRDTNGHQNDFYAKYNLVGSNIQAIGGYRNHMHNQSDSLYGGLAVSAPSIMGFQPYASYVKGSNFGEAQIGVNFSIAMGVGVNVNYHNYVPDNGSTEHGLGAGVTFKF